MYNAVTMDGMRVARRFRVSGVLVAVVLLCAHCTEEPRLSFKPIWVREGIAFEDSAGRIRCVDIDAALPAGSPSMLRLAKSGLTLVPCSWSPGETIEADIDYRIPTSRERDRKFQARFRAPQKQTPLSVVRLGLGSALALVTGSAAPAKPTSVAVDVSGTRVASSSSNGAAAVYALPDGEAIWRKSIAAGYIKSLAFSLDGDVLYVGEQSRDGYVYAIDMEPTSVAFGEAKWKFRLADDLGSEGSVGMAEDTYAWVKLPGAFRIQALPGGDILILGCHSWEASDGGHQLSRLYRLGADGSLRWAWPSEGVLPLLGGWVDASRDGDVVVISGEERFGGAVNPKGEYRPGTVFVLNRTGQQVASVKIAPNEAYFEDVYFWRGLSLRPDGRVLSVTTIDGRAFLYDLGDWDEDLAGEPEVLQPSWQDEIATPFDVGGVPVLATLGTVGTTEAWSLVVSGGSYVVPGTRTGSGQPPGLHPNGLTIFGSRWDGAIAWQYRLEAATQGMAVSSDGRYAAVALSSSAPAKSPDSFHGVSLFSLNGDGSGPERLLYTYPIEGAVPYGGIAVSGDGLVVALLETTLTTQDGLSTVGANQIHILR